MSHILQGLKTNFLIEQEIRNNQMLLESVVSDMTFEQRTIVEGIYKEMLPLIEATLTADQINQIFQQAEKGATDAGSNRTLLGKAVDVPKKANELINNLGKYLQDTAPVKFADQKFEDLKKKVGAKFPELDKQLTGLGTWMKENPGKSAFVIGVLTTLAGLAGGPVGGAIAGQVLRGAAELIKGEKFSTAVGKGIKTAAFGFVTGKALEWLGSAAEALRIKEIPFGIKDLEDAGIHRVSITADIPGASIDIKNVLVDDEMRDQLNWAMKMMKDADPKARLQGWQTLKDVAEIVRSNEYHSNLVGIARELRNYKIDNDSLLNWINGITKTVSSMGQGAVAGGMAAGDKAAKPAATTESVVYNGKKLSEAQVTYIFGKVSEKLIIREGVWDTIKGAAGKAAGAVKQFGTNLTTKVTADKLLTAWKKAGSPTDSEAVAKLMTGAGVPQEVVNNVYTTMKIPTTAPASAPAAPAQAPSASTAPATSGAPTAAAPSAAPGGATTPSAPTAATPSASGSTTPATSVAMTLSQVKQAAKQLRARDRRSLIKFIEGGAKLTEEELMELSTEKLAQYKTAAASDAKKADKAGDFERGNKRFGGIVKATKKQFDNDKRAQK